MVGAIATVIFFAVRNRLSKIQCKCSHDVIATVALNPRNQLVAINKSHSQFHHLNGTLQKVYRRQFLKINC